MTRPFSGALLTIGVTACFVGGALGGMFSINRAMAGQQLLKLSVQPAMIEAHLGQRIRLTVILRNESEEYVGKPGFGDARDYNYTVWDETQSRQLQVKPGGRVYSGLGIVAVAPHSEVKTAFDLDRLFPIAHEGRYRLTAYAIFTAASSSGSMWRDKKVDLTSNTVDIIVTR
jgi:hypothetical protein